MAILFSKVTMRDDYNESEFLVGGFPQEPDDLEGWTAYHEFLDEISEDTVVNIQAQAFLYKLVGDYYLIAGDDELEERPIGIWGQRHLRYLKQHRRTVYSELLTSGKLYSYLAELNEQAENMFFWLVKELAKKKGITETLKAENQILWVQRMNAVRATATEIVNSDLIYA